MAAPGTQAGGMVGYWKRREDEDENDEGLGQGLLDPDEPLAHASGAQEPAWLIRFRAALVLLGSLTFLASTSFIPVFHIHLKKRLLGNTELLAVAQDFVHNNCW